VIIVDDGSNRVKSYRRLGENVWFSYYPDSGWARRQVVQQPIGSIQYGDPQSCWHIIVLQNPEVLHTGDILADIGQRINDKCYLAYGVYATPDAPTQKICRLDYETPEIFNDIKSALQPMNSRAAYTADDGGWYNHSLYRPVAFHFLCAITKTNMDKLRGFDERYAMGVDRMIWKFSPA